MLVGGYLYLKNFRLNEQSVFEHYKKKQQLCFVIEKNRVKAKSRLTCKKY